MPKPSNSELTLSRRIQLLEEQFPQPPGTVLTRVYLVDKEKPMSWSLGLGQAGGIKTFFDALTIIGCVEVAEATLNNKNQ